MKCYYSLSYGLMEMLVPRLLNEYGVGVLNCGSLSPNSLRLRVDEQYGNSAP